MDDPGKAMPREPSREAAVHDSMRPAVPTVELHAHVAAAAYLMRQSHTTALIVIANDASRRPVATITDTDIARAVVEGIDIDEAHIDDLVADGRLHRLSGLSPARGRGAS